MCGEFMTLKERTRVERVAGTTEQVPLNVLEWVCAECDYFEEADESDLRSPQA